MTYVPMDANFAILCKNMITIRQLLQHKFGVFDVINDFPDTVSVQVPYKVQDYSARVMRQDTIRTSTFDELVGVAAKCRLYYFEPRRSFHYSNTGYSILEKSVERVSALWRAIPHRISRSSLSPIHGTPSA